MLLGRLAIATIFILAGVGKFLNYEGTAAYMASKGFSMVPFFLYAAATVEILGGLLLVLGWKTRFGAIILALFLIATTVIFHDFWRERPELVEVQMINFLKNLAIFGGLLYILATGPGSISIDRLCKNRCS
jgi:putative oxidoreductase